MDPDHSAAPQGAGRGGRPPAVRAAAAGLVVAAVAVGVAELAAGVLGLRSPVVAVGDQVVLGVPEAVKALAIGWFGTANKVALVVGILVVLGAAGALIGVVAVRSVVVAAAGIVLFGVVGAVAAAGGVDSAAVDAVPSVVGVAAGLWALWWLVRRLVVEQRSTDAAPDATDPDGRRRFLLGAVALTAVAAGAGATGRWLSGRADAVASRLAVVLPAARRRLAPVPVAASVGVDGVSPLLTPNDRFYRIDTALVIPQVPAETWDLRIHGLVEHEVTVTYAELLARDLVEADVTLACVSNEVGGDLVGTARWLGAPLAGLLEEAGVDPRADQLVGRSEDGWECGFPVSAVGDGRTALVAVGMNGEPLPVRHGFPARLVVAGLYGYVSATKWLREIELTTFEDFTHYWARGGRGWAVEAPVKTQCRIDTPRRGAEAGPVAIAGVAWAPTTGVRRVEVQVDDGPWQEAVLADELSGETWRQWVQRWDATPGRHTVRARATDRTGATQPEERSAPFPDGATGWHTITVEVAEG
ncbi:MAG TPA: molybdopterin-dependent oxidoreductase [Acidimicrobiales bacterium]|nr:molybdopterin-dependent oxidoreductase [Acidimicrobiales bacterium]